ncbi:hypothetical protein FRB99_005571 [Tulasnella sp. 403]|nr:hypothetical protein FRB99_005571 [Tulasnella sp. 403]
MKPQPIHISMMMRRRRDARQRRLDRLPHVAEFQNYLVMEQQFEKSLAKSLGKKAFKPVFKDDWASPLEDQMQRMAESGKREEHMARMKYSPELLEQVRQARITKIENKTREKERERRGEVLSHTRKRMNKGLPAHLLGAKESLRHKMLLDPSEGGYTGMVKKMAGMKLVQDTEEMENAASNEIKEVEEAVWQEGRRRAAGSGQ